jgi:hypothetical protein
MGQKMDSNEFFSNETLLPIIEKKYKEHIQALYYFNGEIEGNRYNLNPERVHTKLRQIYIRPVTKSVLVNGEVEFDKTGYTIIINQALIYFFLHACMLFVSNINFVKGTGITLPNLPKGELEKYIEKQGSIPSNVGEKELARATIELIHDFWNKKPFSSFFVDYYNKLESHHQNFTYFLLESMLSFVAAHELAHVLLESPDSNIRTSAFDFYVKLARTMAEGTVPDYIERADQQSSEYTKKILGGLTVQNVIENWKAEFSADIVGTLISILARRGNETDEAKRYASDCFAYVGSELTFVLMQLLEDYYVHTTDDLPYFNSHPFGKDRFNFIRLLAENNLFPKFFDFGNVWRKKADEISRMVDEEYGSASARN